MLRFVGIVLLILSSALVSLSADQKILEERFTRLFTQGYEAYEKQHSTIQDYSEALTLLTEADAMVGGSHEVLSGLLASIYHEEDDLQNAKIHYERALKGSSDIQISLLQNYAMLCSRLGEYDSALDALHSVRRILEEIVAGTSPSQVVSVDTANAELPTVYDRIGQYNHLAGRLDEAEKWYNEARAKKPSDYKYYTHIAKAQVEQGRLDAAVRTLRPLSHPPHPLPYIHGEDALREGGVGVVSSDGTGARPKGVLLYLCCHDRMEFHDILRSLALVDMHFNKKFQYPVLIVHEGLSEQDARAIKAATSGEVRFAEITFSIPEHMKNTPIPKNLYGRWNMGYRHMCRFFSYEVFSLPELQEFEYYWRLDSDSFVMAPVDRDPFQHMHDNGFVYGYHTIRVGDRDRKLTEGMYDVTARAVWEHDHVNATTLPSMQHFLQESDGETVFSGDYFYNNFEIVHIPSFRDSEALQHHFRALDAAGGFYLRRWGDAIVRLLQVHAVLRLPPSQIVQLSDVPYAHQPVFYLGPHTPPSWAPKDEL
eukprot:Rmarinus@m.10344